MIEVRQTDTFREWLGGLNDVQARARIVVRIRRLEAGNLGDAKFFSGMGELRIDYGAGYRIYFVRNGLTLVILLCGGDKRTQRADIAKAKRLAKEL